MAAASLVDTNILVYRHDFRFPEKERRASKLLTAGVVAQNMAVSHQALVEFVAAVTRPRGGVPLLTHQEALREVDLFMQVFEVIYPTPRVIRTALVGRVIYELPWYDAHMWAYAEANGIPEIVTEDFQHGRLYGGVRAVNPFRGA